MRRMLLIAVLVAANAGAEPAAAAPRCQTAGKTLMASSQVRVFRSSGLTYACWVRHRRVRRLGAGGDPAPHGSPQLAVAARWVAWTSADCGFDDSVCVFTVHVMDVRTGRRARSNLDGGDATTSLVLDRRGIPAWIEHDGSTTRVVARGRDGSRHVLDEDPRINPRSLALARRYVYWSVDGQARTARLP